MAGAFVVGGAGGGAKALQLQFLMLVPPSGDLLCRCAPAQIAR